MYHSGPPDWGRDGPRGRAGFRGGYNDGPRGGPGARGPPPGPPGVGQQQAPQEAELVDREKTCPLLLRVFVRNGAHHKLEEFADRNKLPPESQVRRLEPRELAHGQRRPGAPPLAPGRVNRVEGPRAGAAGSSAWAAGGAWRTTHTQRPHSHHSSQ